MLGAIFGDIAGSHYENFPDKTQDIEFFREHTCFTDDTVLTVAVADWLVNGGELHRIFHDYVMQYPNAGYGGTFINWAKCRETEPYNSWGNGSAMRVSPVAYARDTMDDVLEIAALSANVTHSHPEGVKGAQATAACVFLARTGFTKSQIRGYVEEHFQYDLSRKLSSIRPSYVFDVSCAGSVPESIISFLESDSFDSAIRNAISLGGDSDTMACIAGAIAEPFYGGVPANLWARACEYLDPHLLAITKTFQKHFTPPPNAG